MKSFQLNDIERRSLTQQNELTMINEYGWKNLNVLRLNPSKQFTAGDTEVNFQLDSSLLASNMPINRIQMEISYEVIATSLDTGLSGLPIYHATLDDNTQPEYLYPVVLPAGTNFTTDPATQNNISFASYLTSPSNGGLDYLVGNKSFSNIKIKNGANELRDDIRSAEKMDIMSRLLSTEKMIKEGLHPDFEKGKYTVKAGGDLELLPLIHVNKGTTGELVYSDIYAKGCSPRDTLHNNMFWKRNTNGQYIEYGNTYFKKVADNNWTAGLVPQEIGISSVVSEMSPIRDIYELNPYTDVKKHWYHTVPDDTYFSPLTASQVPIQQKTNMVVYEDLIGDIFTTKYNKSEHYRPLPASQMNFTFTILPEKLLSNLYKTSNGMIKNVRVQITGMKLNIFTFNNGLLNIEPSPYYVPYYQEKSDVQSVLLSAPTVPDPEPTTKVVLQTLKYNKVPPIIAFYASEQLDTNVIGSQFQNLNTIQILELEMTINNDQGTALYSLTNKELKEMTVKNFGLSDSNYGAMYGKTQQTTSICTGLEAISEEWASTTFTGGINWKMGNDTFRRITNDMGFMNKQSFIEGVYLLKLGENIRIDPTMCGSMNKPVSITFKVTFGQNYYSNNNPSRKIAFNSVAFFPYYYLMNPYTGLIKSQDFVIEEAEFYEMVSATNKNISEMRNGTNQLKYNTETPNLMMGSGWFSNLLGTIGTVASFIPGPVGSVVSMGSNLLKNAMGGEKKKSKK